MKRLLALSLALCLLLCACASQPAQEPTQTEAPTTAPITAPTTTPITESATESPSESPVPYRHPLNGAPLEAPFTTRATAVVINNIVDCLPQYGLGNADIIFELETEGGITRLLALFSSLENTGSIGPVRSARTFFNSIARGYDLPLIHCGGSAASLNAQADEYTTLSNWEHINEQYNGSYFFRDSGRTSSYSWEHTLFTSGELLLKGLAAKEYDKPYQEGVDFGLLFDEEATPDGEDAQTVTITFRYGKTTTMTYNPDNGLYSASQYSRNHIDAATGEVLSYRNVLALYTEQRGIYDGTYTRSYYTLVGEGTGYFACGGKLIPIRWSRADVDSPFCFMQEDGSPLVLGVGTTYVGICSNKMDISYE